jgi:hypothetical protein
VYEVLKELNKKEKKKKKKEKKSLLAHSRLLSRH